MFANNKCVAIDYTVSLNRERKMMRIRERNIYQTHGPVVRTDYFLTHEGEYVYENSPGNLIEAGSFPVSYSYMEDTVGFRRNQPVIHKLITLDAPGVQIVTFEFIDGPYIHRVSYSGDTLAWVHAFASDLKTLTGFRGVHKTLDPTRIAFNLAEVSNDFLGIEFARDLLHLIHSARSLNVRKSVSGAKKLLKRFRINPKSTLGGVKRALSTTSDGFLAYNFGVKPLVADVVALGAAHAAYRSQLTALQLAPAQGLKKLSQGYKASISTSDDDPPAPGSDYGLACRLKTGQDYFRISGWVKDARSYVKETFLGYLKSQLRLTDIIGLAWEFIPFSFAADWFLHIDDRIQASKAYFDSSFVRASALKDRTDSRKWVESQDLYLVLSTIPSTLFPSMSRAIGSVKITEFVRNLPGVIDPQVGTVADYGTHQRRLTAALLWQKVRRFLK